MSAAALLSGLVSLLWGVLVWSLVVGLPLRAYRSMRDGGVEQLPPWERRLTTAVGATLLLLFAARAGGRLAGAPIDPLAALALGVVLLAYPEYRVGTSA